jgi:hypothetical protein
LVIESEYSLAYRAGVEYLQQISEFLPDTKMVDVMANLRDRVAICTWIGHSIESVNLRLQSCLKACDECFNPIDRRSIHIFAVPFATAVRLDGFCNIDTNPTTILIDVGRVPPQDWLALVAHEYAHAHLGVAGHDAEYARILDRLCLGLGLPSIQQNSSLYHWPPYRPTLDPVAFWRGES